MKYIVAVSGGVDSVALLHMLAHRADTINELGVREHDSVIVAHFDHGIRYNSSDDARFVAALAHRYGFRFETVREELGESASEELARTRRYLFLRSLSKKYNATIITAHHKDDLVETIAINLSRGTGWRGLAVLNSPDVIRPLISTTKHTIYTYAVQNSLEWIEDETNKLEKYYRNKIRKVLQVIPTESKEKLYALRQKQVVLAREIDAEVEGTINEWQCRRYPYTMSDEASTVEILRHATHKKLTRPQLKKLLLAIKTARPHTKYQCGNGVLAEFSLDEFTLSML